jgi:mannonate dehydratase
VHYRNLLGGRYSFREALPDEGDMDFCKVLKTLKDVGYCYGIDPDHVPRTEDDPLGYYQSYAYCFGYINAMIQAVYA